MRTKLYLIGLGVILSTGVFAQKEKSDNNSPAFGIKAGVNIANQTAKAGSVSISSGSLAGITGGFFANLPVGTNGLSIQPELLYSMMGSKVSFQGESEKSELSYLSVPVLAKYNIDKPGFGVYLGPQIGFLLSAKDKSGSESTDTKSSYKSTDVSAVAGLEYGFSMGVNVSARYQIGLTNIAKDIADDVSFKNNAFTVTIGYQF